MESRSSTLSANEERVPAGHVPALEVVILIGLRGSGKSTFRSQRLAETHAVVSKDLIRHDRRPERRQRQLILAALASSLSVVVDDPNLSVEERAGIIATARVAGARVTGYFFDSPPAECAARNQQRGRTMVPEVAVFAAAKRLVRPSGREGFSEIVIVRTLPDRQFEVIPDEDTGELARAAARGPR